MSAEEAIRAAIVELRKREIAARDKSMVGHQRDSLFALGQEDAYDDAADYLENRLADLFPAQEAE